MTETSTIAVTPLAEIYARLREDICNDFTQAKFRFPDEVRNDTLKAVIAYFRTLQRSIPVGPREVVWSKELHAKTLPHDILAAVKGIEKESENGVDLNPRLTRRFFKTAFNDVLWNDLGVQHMHLGPPGVEKNGQAGGTKELLFVLVHKDTLFFVDLLDHDAFENTDFLPYVESNWPKMLDAWELRGLRGSDGPPLSPQERSEARKAGITVLTTVNGRVIHPPGGGLATDGTSIRAVDQAMHFLSVLRGHHQWVEAGASDFVRSLSAQAAVAIKELNLRARRSASGEVYFQDVDQGIYIHPERGKAFYRIGALE